MPLEVAIYQIDQHHRSRVVCDVMMAGIKTLGDKPRLFREREYLEPIGDVAVFYGLTGKLPKIFRDYKAAGKKVVYVDLGYWARRQGGRFAGYHKVSVNDRHPTAYFQARRHDNARALNLGVAPRPWRTTGTHILLAGMGDKGAIAEGFRPEQWERAVIREIRQYTDRPIVYRPKPSWRGARPITGTIFSPSTQDLSEVLADCFAIATHHSNVAVDGIIDGIPAVCWKGVASPLASQEAREIENLPRSEKREQWIADIAHVQYSVDEMRAGWAWRYLRNEGLVG